MNLGNKIGNDLSLCFIFLTRQAGMMKARNRTGKILGQSDDSEKRSLFISGNIVLVLKGKHTHEW